MARPTKLTPQVHAILVDAVRRGASYALAASAAGIHAVTFEQWRAAGKLATQGRAYELVLAIQQAEAEAALMRLDRLRVAGEEHWQADAWWLERRFPQDFGRRITEVDLRVSLREIAHTAAAAEGLDPDELILEAEHWIAAKGLPS
ncbi:MAG TPA: hypothetical protein VH475_23950 [Tepidisphaeraceae bacterium]|jgi:hypothetical protein